MVSKIHYKLLQRKYENLMSNKHETTFTTDTKKMEAQLDAPQSVEKLNFTSFKLCKKSFIIQIQMSMNGK